MTYDLSLKRLTIALIIAALVVVATIPFLSHPGPDSLWLKSSKLVRSATEWQFMGTSYTNISTALELSSQLNIEMNGGGTSFKMLLTHHDLGCNMNGTINSNPINFTTDFPCNSRQAFDDFWAEYGPKIEEWVGKEKAESLNDFLRAWWV